jgi:hypothetical protein
VVSHTYTQITCTVAAYWAGSPSPSQNQPVVVTLGPRTSNSLSYAYDPAVNTISPAGGPAAGGTTITLSGSALGPIDGVKLGSAVCTITSQSSSQIQCVTPAGNADQPVILCESGSCGYGNSYELSFNYDAPVITSVAANIAGNGNSGTLDIYGSNFGPVASNLTVMVYGLSTPVQLAGVTLINDTTSPAHCSRAWAA